MRCFTPSLDCLNQLLLNQDLNSTPKIIFMYLPATYFTNGGNKVNKIFRLVPESLESGILDSDPLNIDF